MPLTAHDARDEDYADFVRMFLELRVPDPTPTPEQFAARIRPHTFFLREGESAVGYSFWLPMGDVARVVHVAVDAGRQGRGVGTALMTELAARARRAGCTRWDLNVKPDNVPAIRLYERFGMKAVARTTSMKIAWADVARLPLEEGTEAFVVAPDEDARVEASVGLHDGQIGALRKLGGRVFVGLRKDGGVVALAAFDPSFPGAFPFAVPRVGLVRALLEGMRPHARPDLPFVRFTTDSAIAEGTRGAGAEAVLEILSMRGPIAT